MLLFDVKYWAPRNILCCIYITQILLPAFSMDLDLQPLHLTGACKGCGSGLLVIAIIIPYRRYYHACEQKIDNRT